MSTFINKYYVEQGEEYFLNFDIDVNGIKSDEQYDQVNTLLDTYCCLMVGQFKPEEIVSGIRTILADFDLQRIELFFINGDKSCKVEFLGLVLNRVKYFNDFYGFEGIYQRNKNVQIKHHVSELESQEDLMSMYSNLNKEFYDLIFHRLMNINSVTLSDNEKFIVGMYQAFYGANPNFSSPAIFSELEVLLRVVSQYGIFLPEAGDDMIKAMVCHLFPLGEVESCEPLHWLLQMALNKDGQEYRNNSSDTQKRELEKRIIL